MWPEGTAAGGTGQVRCGREKEPNTSVRVTARLRNDTRTSLARIRGRVMPAVLPGSRLYFLSAFTLSLVNATPIPLLPALRDSFDLNNQQIAFLGSVSGVGMVISNWPVGYLVHRLGSRRMLVVGLVPLTAGPILSATAMTFWQLLLGTMLTGVGFASLLTTNIGGLGELADSRAIGTTMGVLNRTMLIGTFVGPLLSGAIAGSASWRLSFAVVGAVACGLLLLTIVRYHSVAQAGGPWNRPHEERKPDHLSRLARALPSGVARPLLLVFFLYFLVIYSRASIVQYLLPLIGKDLIGLSVQSVGALLSLGTLVTMAVVVPVGMHADRVGAKRTLLLVTTSLLLAEILVLISPTAVGFTLAIVLLGFAGTGTAVVYTLFSQLSRQHALQRSLGPFRFSGDLGIVVGPLSMGVLVEHLGFRAGLLGTIGVAVSAMVCLVASLRHDAERGSSASAQRR